MAQFESKRFRGLALQDDKGVWAKFEDGLCETSDAAVAKRLRALPDEYEVTEVKASAKSDGGSGGSDKAPSKAASKEDWVAWAVACGAEPDQASARTRDELVEQYADASPKQ
ncbi:hypothetical protein AB0A91_29335 [Streptomyces sp. NPDC042207]|uniref:hypothetical protein n=1 Tax=Streptomyces sp. NPDC042207 TaxID=3154331 RepID=UPI0033F7C3A1